MMTVLSVAYPFAPVGPHAVGGAEQILDDLDRALVRAGHRSRVVAQAGSRVRGELIPVETTVNLLEADRALAIARVDAAIAAGLADGAVDVVHLHGLDFHRYTVPGVVPVLVTLHMPPDWYPPEIWHRFGPRYRFQCVSRTQRAGCPPAFQDLPVIENGVRLRPSVAETRADFALALGRICPEKNLHEALEAGTQAGLRVLVGGQVFPYPAHLDYSHRTFEPMLGGPLKHRFLGPLRPRRKARLLSRARCLLLPTLAPETSSLVAMEAMAAGTPVIAYRSGAIPEIVEDGVTGWLVRDAAEMAEAIGRAWEISPEMCQQTARRRFSRGHMTGEYLALYRRLTAGSGEANHAA